MSPLKFGLLAAVAVATLPASASALETGQCLPAAQVRSALAAEGQNPIILGNRTGYGYKTAFIFMSDATGSRGYLVRGDKPLGEQAETICIDSVYRDIRLNDITRPGIPAWAMMTVDAAWAEADCRANRLGFQEICTAYDRSLAALEGNGQHVMFSAVGTAINPRDHSIRQDQRLVLTIDAVEYGGLFKAVTGSGASYMISAYTSASYTQHGERLLANVR